MKDDEDQLQGSYCFFNDLMPRSSGDGDLVRFGVEKGRPVLGEGQEARGVRDSLAAKIDLYVSWIWKGLSS